MSITSLVTPGGSVVGVDLSANMTEIARKTAAKRGIRNIEFVTMDAEELNFSEGSFDVAVSCFGFQIVTNPEAAAKEMFRVLRPEGRAGFTVWSKGDRTPALDVIISPMMEHATPDEDGYLPTPYELGGPHELATLLEEIGFTNPTEVRNIGSFEARSIDDYLTMLLEGSPIGHSLNEETKEIQETVRTKTRNNIARYATAEGISIPAECVVVVASKPV
jgi:ubiquinone/menaquinone biosynthesis C-methylase UbiE